MTKADPRHLFALTGTARNRDGRTRKQYRYDTPRRALTIAAKSLPFEITAQRNIAIIYRTPKYCEPWSCDMAKQNTRRFFGANPRKAAKEESKEKWWEFQNGAALYIFYPSHYLIPDRGVENHGEGVSSAGEGFYQVSMASQGLKALSDEQITLNRTAMPVSRPYRAGAQAGSALVRADM